MIMMQVNGRLGNQMFQYAFARKLWEQVGRRGKIYLEFIANDNNLKYFNVNFKEIPSPKSMANASFWNLKLHIAKPVIFAIAIELIASRIWSICVKFIKKSISDNCLVYEHKWEKTFGWLWSFFGLYVARYGYIGFRYPAYMRYLPIHAYGCFECSKYFDDIKPILQDEFTPKFPLNSRNLELYNMISESESVCIHIRRGDYLNDSFRDAFYLCTPDYFSHAMEIMKTNVPNARFFVFSDEPQWCKENIPFPFECVYESGQAPIYETMRLMYSCKHFIISNSTFSWWAQYLSRNEDKIVIAPNKWRNGSYTLDIYKNQNWLLYDLETNKLCPNKFMN